MDRHLLENIAQQVRMAVHAASSRRLAVCPTESNKVQTAAGKAPCLRSVMMLKKTKPSDIYPDVLILEYIAQENN